MIFVISIVDLVGIDVYIVIFIMMKFQTLRAFPSSSVQLLLTIPSATQCPLCATQSYQPCPENSGIFQFNLKRSEPTSAQ